MRRAALMSIALSVIGSAWAGDMIEVTRKPIQIGPQALSAGIQTLGEIEGLHVVFLSEDVENRNTTGVNGSLSYAEALEQLLRGTGLTFRFLEAHTAMILPAGAVRGAPVELMAASGSGDAAEKGVVASLDPGVRVAQVTVTAARQYDAQQLEYFRLLAAMSRTDYKHLVKTLPFVDSGTVRFPGVGGNRHERPLPLGHHEQSAGVDGIVLTRVFDFTPKQAESQLQVHNSNSFPVFVEVDYETALGDGAAVALAPGETLAIWFWAPTVCEPPRVGLAGLTDWGCEDYNIWPGTAHVHVLKEWEPG